MYRAFIIGEKIYLRGLEEADLQGDYFDWLNDREVTRFMESGVFPNSMQKMEEYYRNTALTNNNVIFAIVDRETDKHIGTIRLGPISWRSQVSPVGLMIGRREFWGKGYGTESIKLVVDYAFKRLNLHKLTSGVVAINQASVKAFQKAGFEIEGKAKGSFFVDGKYYDSLYLGITREDFLTTG